MRAADLQGVSRRKQFVTTRRDASASAAPDLVNRQFRATAPNQLWVADITDIPTAAGFLSLAVVLDGRRFVSRAEARIAVFDYLEGWCNLVSIAQIEARARGAGSEFVLACDMRFAARESAIFGQPEAGTGVNPGAGGVQHLSHVSWAAPGRSKSC